MSAKINVLDVEYRQLYGERSHERKAVEYLASEPVNTIEMVLLADALMRLAEAAEM